MCTNHKFTECQKAQIRLGKEAKLSAEEIAVYAQPKFNWAQMWQIRLGQEAKLSAEEIAVYAQPELHWSQMEQIRYQLASCKKAKIDEYLDTEKSYNRLKEEFKTHKRLIIAYDLDSTVFDYHHTNASYEMVKDLIRKYRKYAYFIVFTSSEPDRYDEIKAILKKENLPYDSINDDAPFIPFKGRKVYYNILLDDRAGLNQTYHELLRLYNEVIVNLEENS